MSTAKCTHTDRLLTYRDVHCFYTQCELEINWR